MDQLLFVSVLLCSKRRRVWLVVFCTLLTDCIARGCLCLYRFVPAKQLFSPPFCTFVGVAFGVLLYCVVPSGCGLLFCKIPVSQHLVALRYTKHTLRVPKSRNNRHQRGQQLRSAAIAQRSALRSSQAEIAQRRCLRERRQIRIGGLAEAQHVQSRQRRRGSARLAAQPPSASDCQPPAQ
jgi:hypothetical protein